jgi:hypothetical protein
LAHNHKDDDFPTGILRGAFGSLLTHIGLGDGQLRAFLLEHLSSVQHSPSSRQVLLDFLPSAIPAVQNYSVINSSFLSSPSKELEAVTRQVIDTLRTVLSKDPAALLPVLGCLSIMPLSETGRKEAFQVALVSLDYVSESELPTLVTTLLRHAETEEDARCALEALRTEIDAVEFTDNNTRSDRSKGDDPSTMVVHVVLNTLLDDENDNRIAKAYAGIFQRLSENQTIHSKENKVGRSDASLNGNENSVIESLLKLDLAVLLSI